MATGDNLSINTDQARDAGTHVIGLGYDNIADDMGAFAQNISAWGTVDPPVLPDAEKTMDAIKSKLVDIGLGVKSELANIAKVGQGLTGDADGLDRLDQQGQYLLHAVDPGGTPAPAFNNGRHHNLGTDNADPNYGDRLGQLLTGDATVTPDTTPPAPAAPTAVDQLVGPAITHLQQGQPLTPGAPPPATDSTATAAAPQQPAPSTPPAAPAPADPPPPPVTGVTEPPTTETG